MSFQIPVTCLSWEVLLRLRSHFSWQWVHWRQKSENHLLRTFCLCLLMISGGSTLDFMDQKSTLQPLTRWPEKGLYSTIIMFNRFVHQPEEHLWLEGIPFTQVWLMCRCCFGISRKALLLSHSVTITTKSNWRKVTLSMLTLWAWPPPSKGNDLFGKGILMFLSFCFRLGIGDKKRKMIAV